MVFCMCCQPNFKTTWSDEALAYSSLGEIRVIVNTSGSQIWLHVWIILNNPDAWASYLSFLGRGLGTEDLTHSLGDPGVQPRVRITVLEAIPHPTTTFRLAVSLGQYSHPRGKCISSTQLGYFPLILWWSLSMNESFMHSFTGNLERNKIHRHTSKIFQVWF